MTQEEFISLSEIKHNRRYIYDKVIFKNKSTKVDIICKKHGVFPQAPKNHIKGQGCPKCAGNIKSNIGEFIKEANLIHNNKYDYSKSVYINASSKIKIICENHGEFYQVANDHLGGHGCALCHIDNLANIKRNNTVSFINKCKMKHNDYYDYSLVDYKLSTLPVVIICPKHGEFKQKANDHASGKGCPDCQSSLGENEIESILKTYNINFIKQYKFDYCKNINKLPFDFYLKDYNICIEYDGIQHFKPLKYFGGIEGFEYRKNNDNIKNNYCLNNNITLYRISYMDNINDKMKAILQYIKGYKK